MPHAMITLRTMASALNVPHELCTVTPGDRIVPWLAAKGANAYTPDQPPHDESLFDYGAVMPCVFKNPGRYLFGGSTGFADSTLSTAPAFWRAAMASQVQCLSVFEGGNVDDRFHAPYALYHWSDSGNAKYTLMQSGSYQTFDAVDHPEVEQGVIRLYRGLEYAPFYQHKVLQAKGCDISSQFLQSACALYFDIATSMFLSSGTAFQYAHGGTARSETEHITKGDLGTHLNEICRLTNIDRNGILLRVSAFVSMSLENEHFSTWKLIAEEKFGPHYIEVETPLSNIRISSDFSNEYEARLIDPDNITVIGAHGCKLSRVNIVEQTFRNVDGA